MRRLHTHTDPYRPANDRRLPPPPVTASLALTLAVPVAVYLLTHPTMALAVLTTAVATAFVVDRD